MVRASRSPQRSTIALDILLGNHPGATLRVARAEHNVRAHLRECCRHLPPQSAAPARDDGDPPAQVEQLFGVHPFPSLLPTITPAVQSAGAGFRAVSRRAAAPRAP